MHAAPEVKEIRNKVIFSPYDRIYPPIAKVYRSLSPQLKSTSAGERKRETSAGMADPINELVTSIVVGHYRQLLNLV